MNKAPAYLWYPKDILTSIRVAALEPLEELWYRRALDYCWLHESLPADPSELAKIIGRGCTVKGATSVAQMFVEDRKNKTRIIHDRQEAERKKQAKNRRMKSKAGKESAAKRRKQKELEEQKEGNTCSTEAQQKNPVVLEQNPNLSIPISSSIPTPVKPLNPVCAPARANPEIDAAETEFTDTVLDGLRSRYQLNVLRDEAGWCDQVTWAFQNGFTADQFLECHDLLKKQTWRQGRITPKNVADNLPELDRVKQEIEEKVNGTNQQNTKITSTDRIRQYESILDKYPTEAELRERQS